MSRSLDRAKNAKQDEFYTQLPDIENELKHYRSHFVGKTILCNCDDPYESNFFKYFASNFNHLGIKKLIATCYNGSPVQGLELPFPDENKNGKQAFKVEITEVKDLNGDGRVDLSDVKYLIQNDKNVLTELEENGDFRSPECIELLKEADIVVTNPPFSLFREYIDTLMKYEKKFVIVAPYNAITYKEIFPLIKTNKIWLGYGFKGGNAYFKIPQNSNRDFAAGVFDEVTNLVKFRNCTWFTNLDHKKRHEELILYKKYTPEEYPKYDNYDAINVDKVTDIPCDYYGVMGVPITFLDKYNPEQFEIVEFRKGNDGKDLVYSIIEQNRTTIQPYFRILVRRC